MMNLTEVSSNKKIINFHLLAREKKKLKKYFLPSRIFNYLQFVFARKVEDCNL